MKILAAFFILISLTVTPGLCKDAPLVAEAVAEAVAGAVAGAPASHVAGAPDAVEELIGKNPRSIETSLKYSPRSSASAQEGGIGLIESNTGFEYKFALSGKQPVTISFQHRYIDIDNSTQVSLPDRLVGFDLGIETMYQLNNFSETYLSLGVSPSFYSDDWDLHAFKFRIPTHCYFIRRPDKKTTLIAGIMVDSDFDYYVFPVLGLIYEPTEKLTFVLIPDKPSINYSISDKLSVFVEGNIDLDQEFKVSQDHGHAILRYEELKAGAGVSFAFNDHFLASLSAGGVFKRRFQYKDSQFGKVCLKDGLYSEFKLQLEF